MYRWLRTRRCKHQWQEFTPLGYQPDVRMKQCVFCHRLYNEGIRGEHGQIIPYGFHAITKQPLFGASTSTMHRWLEVADG